MKLKLLNGALGIFVAGILLQGCQEASEVGALQKEVKNNQPSPVDIVQPEKLLSEENQPKQNQPEQKQEEVASVKPVEKKVVIQKPKAVEQTAKPVAAIIEEKPRKALDVSLDNKTMETIRLDVPEIMDRPMELPDLFGKYEKQVNIKSRVLVDSESTGKDKVDGAEINVQVKVK